MNFIAVRTEKRTPDAARRREPTPQERAEKLRLLFLQWEEEARAKTPEQIASEEAAWREVERGLAEDPVSLRSVDVGADA